MRALLSGKLGIFAFLIFLVLILGGLLVQHIVNKMRWEILMAEYEAQRGPVEEAPKPPPAEELLPGYTMLTFQDYEEIEAALKQKLKEEPESFL